MQQTDLKLPSSCLCCSEHSHRRICQRLVAGHVALLAVERNFKSGHGSGKIGQAASSRSLHSFLKTKLSNDLCGTGFVARFSSDCSVSIFFI